MKKLPAPAFLLVIGIGLAYAQATSVNWPTFGGDAQRSGWEKTDVRITKTNAKDLQLLFKMKLEGQSKGTRQLMPPVILGRLISYRGFKELAFVGTNSDIIYAIDTDLGKIFWQKHLEYSTSDPQVTASTAACPGGMTAMPTMAAPGVAQGGRGAAPAPAAAGGARGATNPFVGGPASLYAISSDGRLHRLNTSTGDDMSQPVQVIPANSRASSLNMVGNVIYTVTSQSCNGALNAVWAIDLNGDAPKVTSFALNGGTAQGLGGATIGADGAVYIQTGDGALDQSAQKWSNTLLALSLRDLQLTQYFTANNTDPGSSPSNDANVTSPVEFNYKNRDLIVTAASDGRLYLLDSASMSDHVTPLYRTPVLVSASRSSAGRGIWGSVSSWQDADGTRWVLAPVWGPLGPDLKIPGANVPTPNGAIVAFKLEEQNGKTVLTPSWVSRDMSSSLPPVVANGVVFVLSAGEFSVDERPKGSTHATLYALDAATGKELYSSRNLITAPASLTGITLANGRVYFGTTDGTFYTFGIYQER